MVLYKNELSPLVSIILPIYNAEKYIEQSIQSILNQSYTHFELLLLDDASTDNTPALLAHYTDHRIKLITNLKNRGLIDTLNLGLSLAKGQYIARMDNDDLSLSHRLQTQVNYLEKNSEIMLCGTWVERFGSGLFKSVSRFPTNSEEIKKHLLFECPLSHPSVMFRRDLIDLNFRYNPDFAYAEDHELWVRLSHQFKISNIPMVCLLYRKHKQSMSVQYKEQQQKNAFRCRLLAMDHLMPNEPELSKIYEQLIGNNQLNVTQYVAYSSLFFNRLAIFDGRLACYYQWREACRHANYGLPLFFNLWRLNKRKKNINLKKWLILFCLCLFRYSR